MLRTLLWSPLHNRYTVVLVRMRKILVNNEKQPSPFSASVDSKSQRRSVSSELSWSCYQKIKVLKGLYGFSWFFFTIILLFNDRHRLQYALTPVFSHEADGCFPKNMQEEARAPICWRRQTLAYGKMQHSLVRCVCKTFLCETLPLGSWPVSVSQSTAASSTEKDRKKP